MEHVRVAAELGMDGWCLTDHGTMAGAAEFWLGVGDELVSKGREFKAVAGCEVYVHPDLASWREEYARFQEEKKGKPKPRKVSGPGPELILNPDTEEADTGIAIENEDASKSRSKNPINRRHHLVVLPKSQVGLRNLFNLVTLSYREENFYRYPRIDFRLLKQFGQDLIVSTACIAGLVSEAVTSMFPDLGWNDLTWDLLDDPSRMQSTLVRVGDVVDRLADCVGRGNVLMEIQFNRIPMQHLVNRAVVEFASREKLPLVVTIDSHYPRREMWKARTIYKKLAWMDHEKIDPSTLPKTPDDLDCELHVKNAEGVWESYRKYCSGVPFYDDSVVRDAIERTHDVVHHMIGDVSPDMSVKLPQSVVPEDKTPMKQLTEICGEAMIRKGLASNLIYVERLKRELGVIKTKGFEKYFLLMKEIVDVARECCVRIGPGRGSAAGSLVNYLMGATSIDPVTHGLLFERFLTVERKDLPDIDTDVSDRDALIFGLRKRFGQDNVVYVSNYNVLKLKSLVKDVSKFYGIDFDEVNAVTRIVEDQVKAATQKHGDDKNMFELTYDASIEHCKAFREFMENHPDVAETVQQIHKQIKSIGKHAGGVVILDDLSDKMPIIKIRGEAQSPWVEGLTVKTLARLGLCKMDILGLLTLRMIDGCVARILTKELGRTPTFNEITSWIEKHISPDALRSYEDPEMYRFVYDEERYFGVFQFSSPGAQAFIKQFKPRSVMDVAVATAIYRPGPLAADVDKLYLEARADPGNIRYCHPLVEKVLKPYYGCIVMQESMMEMAHVVGGFDMKDTDAVRKALMKRSVTGKDDAAKKQKELGVKFVEGAVRNGVARHDADDIWQKLLYFSGYAFNLSHSVSYAYDSVACAYLLYNHTDEWVCTWLDSVSEDDLPKALGSLKRFGYTVSNVDVNESSDTWSCKEGKVLVPSFLSLKGVGQAALDEIVANRPYTELADLIWDADGKWRHSKANKRVWDVLVRLGALDSVGLVGEGKLFSNYKQLHHVLVGSTDRLRKKGGIDVLRDVILEAQQLEDWTAEERAQFRKELSGDTAVDLLVSPDIQKRLEEHGVGPLGSLKGGKSLVWFILVEHKEKKTKNGKPYLLLTVTDTTGQTNRIFLWGAAVCSYIHDNGVYLAEVERTGFGFSSNMRKVKKLG